VSDVPHDQGSTPGSSAPVQGADGQWRSADGTWLWSGGQWVANPPTPPPPAVPAAPATPTPPAVPAAPATPTPPAIPAAPAYQPVRPPTAPTSGNRFDWFVRHKVWTAIGAIVILIAIISSATSGGGSKKNAASTTGVTQPTTSTGSNTEPTQPQSPVDRVRSALGSSVHSDLAVGDSKVRSVSRGGKLLTIILSTPEGGFQGPSSDDADGLTSAALAKAYLAGWNGPAFVEFEGGLASRATGQDLPNAEAFAYRMGGGVAKQINWSDDNALFSIDWSIYRIFCHPAFKGCT